MLHLPHRIQSLIELLCDGNCHSIIELQIETELNECETTAVVKFLSEYGFVEMKGGNGSVKISTIAKELFDKKNM